MDTLVRLLHLDGHDDLSLERLLQLDQGGPHGEQQPVEADQLQPQDRVQGLLVGDGELGVDLVHVEGRRNEADQLFHVTQHRRRHARDVFGRRRFARDGLRQTHARQELLRVLGVPGNGGVLVEPHRFRQRDFRHRLDGLKAASA